jgi:hypothetical protein
MLLIMSFNSSFDWTVEGTSSPLGVLRMPSFHAFSISSFCCRRGCVRHLVMRRIRSCTKASEFSESGMANLVPSNERLRGYGTDRCNRKELRRGSVAMTAISGAFWSAIVRRREHLTPVPRPSSPRVVLQRSPLL